MSNIDSSTGSTPAPSVLQAKEEIANQEPKRDSSSSLAADQVANFKPGWRLYTIFLTLCIVTLAAALDATSLSTALPVRSTASPCILSRFFFHIKSKTSYLTSYLNRSWLKS